MAYKSGSYTFERDMDITELIGFFRLVSLLHLADSEKVERIIFLLGGGWRTTKDLTIEEVEEIRGLTTPILTGFPRGSGVFASACQAMTELAKHYGWDQERDLPAECIC